MSPTPIALAATLLPLLADALLEGTGLQDARTNGGKPVDWQDDDSAENFGGDVVNGSWHLCAEPMLSSKGPKSPIPHILHQTYRTKALKGGLARYRDTWFQETPSWKHRLWLDHENRALVKVHYPWFLETYDSYEHTIQRVDAARVFMMHRFGGVYADLDIEAVRDPSPLFNTGHDLVFFYQLAPHVKAATIDPIEGENGKPRLGTISNAFMASKPGHPFWMYLADKMMKGRTAALAEAANAELPHMDIYLTTGPSMLSRALQQYQEETSDANVAIFSKKYWSPFTTGLKDDPCEVHWECRAQFPEAFVVSHWTRTWMKCQKGISKKFCEASTSLLQDSAEVDYTTWCP